MKKINKKMSYGIIGLGRFGTALAIELAASEKEILVVDCDEERVRVMREYTENAFVVKTLDKKSLSETGIQNCDVAIVCIGEKMDTSILTTLYLTSLGIPQVIAKAVSSEHGQILEKMGAEVVYPEHDMAIRLARRLDPSPVINYIELSEKIDISKIYLPERFSGSTVVTADIRKKYGLNIIAIENNDKIITDIDPNYEFKTDDTIIVIGDRDKIKYFELHAK